MNNKLISTLIVPFSLLSHQAVAAGDSTTDGVLSSSFFHDASMDLSLRNYWNYLKDDQSGEETVSNAWGQGASVNYRSGYFMDIIGADVSLDSVIKLGASDHFASRGLLYNKGTHGNKDDADGFTRLGQRYVKIKLGDDAVRLDARGGWQVIKNTGILTNSSRVTSNTYLGYHAALSLPENLMFSGAWVTSAMERYTPDKKEFTTNAGRHIDYIASGQISWKNKNLSLLYGYGESENYLRRHILFADLTPLPALKTGIQIYTTKALDNYTTMPAGRQDFESTASHYAADVAWKEASWSTKWGLGYTRANKENGVGHYSRHMSKNSRGTFISMARANDDYMRDGELMLAGLVDWQLTPEFTAGLTGNIGQFNYKGNHIRTGEISVTGQWKPSHPSLKNLSVKTLVGPGWSYENKGKTPLLHDGHYRHSQALNAEVVVDYRFGVF